MITAPTLGRGRQLANRLKHRRGMVPAWYRAWRWWYRAWYRACCWHESPRRHRRPGPRRDHGSLRGRPTSFTHLDRALGALCAGAGAQIAPTGASAQGFGGPWARCARARARKSRPPGLQCAGRQCRASVPGVNDGNRTPSHNRHRWLRPRLQVLPRNRSRQRSRTPTAGALRRRGPPDTRQVRWTRPSIGGARTCHRTCGSGIHRAASVDRVALNQ